MKWIGLEFEEKINNNKYLNKVTKRTFVGSYIIKVYRLKNGKYEYFFTTSWSYFELRERYKISLGEVTWI